VTGGRRLLAMFSLGVGSVLLQATSCLPGDYGIHHFALTSCPAPTFALPDEARDSLHHARQWRDATPAPGFTIYRTDRGIGTSFYLEARLRPGATCELDVLHPFFRLEFASEAEAYARLLLRDAGVAPVLPAASIERVKQSDLRTWAARTMRDTTR
jgi:hypothetical protein